MFIGRWDKKGTNVSLSTTYLNSNLSLKNLAQLTVNQGALQPKELTSWENEKMNIVIHENGALDLSNYNHIEFNDFVGGGRVCSEGAFFDGKNEKARNNI